jgi:hypothetical protein
MQGLGSIAQLVLAAHFGPHILFPDEKFLNGMKR